MTEQAYPSPEKIVCHTKELVAQTVRGAKRFGVAVGTLILATSAILGAEQIAQAAQAPYPHLRVETQGNNPIYSLEVNGGIVSGFRQIGQRTIEVVAGEFDSNDKLKFQPVQRLDLGFDPGISLLSEDKKTSFVAGTISNPDCHTPSSCSASRETRFGMAGQNQTTLEGKTISEGSFPRGNTYLNRNNLVLSALQPDSQFGPVQDMYIATYKTPSGFETKELQPTSPAGIPLRVTYATTGRSKVFDTAEGLKSYGSLFLSNRPEILSFSHHVDQGTAVTELVNFTTVDAVQHIFDSFSENCRVQLLVTASPPGSPRDQNGVLQEQSLYVVDPANKTTAQVLSKVVDRYYFDNVATG